MDIRKSLLLAMCLLIGMQSYAQRFDWVKSYSGQEPVGRKWNYVVESVTDSHGNLYVAGQFARGASIDGEELLPFSPYGGDIDVMNACILKFSPDGNLLWKKILHANYGRLSSIYGLQLVGDSALYADVFFMIPQVDHSDAYLYFYDTLVTLDNRGSLLNLDTLSNPEAHAISVFDLDGDLKENYILNMAYKDIDGNLIRLDRLSHNDLDTVFLFNDRFNPGQFCVDGDGNIYYEQQSYAEVWLWCDTCEYGLRKADLSNGLISECIIMVNGQLRFSLPVETPIADCNSRIMKFAPHFSDILTHQYVFSFFEGTWGRVHSKLSVGANGNVYLLQDFQSPTNITNINIPLWGDTNLSFVFSCRKQGSVIEYDESLSPIDVVQLVQEQIPSQPEATAATIGDVALGDGMMLVIGNYCRNGYEYDPTYKGQLLNVGNDPGNVYLLKTTGDNHSLEQYGHVRSSMAAFQKTITSHNGMILSNGRIFSQVSFGGNIQFADTNIYVPNNKYGTGICIWDNSLHEIGYIDLSTNLSTLGLLSSSMSIHDSSLYVIFSVSDDVIMADTTMYCTGNSVAVIARYVDGDFALPYTHGGGGNVSIEMAGDESVTCYPNPTTGAVVFVLPDGETATDCNITSAGGVRHKASVSSNTLNLSDYPSGIYYVEIVTTSNVYKQKIIKL